MALCWSGFACPTASFRRAILTFFIQSSGFKILVHFGSGLQIPTSVNNKKIPLLASTPEVLFIVDVLLLAWTPKAV